MKQSSPWSIFQFQNTAWLTQINQTTLLGQLFDLSQSIAFYLVDKEQHILHWSLGMEKLTTVPHSHIYGQICAHEYHINDTTINNTNISINGETIAIKKQILHDANQQIIGGLGILTDSIDPLPRHRPQAMVMPSGQTFHGMISRSPAMQDVFQIIQNAAETEATVLVRGESGSGKELVAKAIHHLSARHQQPFLAINCAALSSNLLESELFGHVRGAFTGAFKDHNGLFRRAHGGTLFLDEVAELPLELQAKLLRVIQERNYIPVGGDKSVDVDVRIVAATHRSLREEVKTGHFREDLMYRLRVVPIFLPPLRERREDISLLIWHFIEQHNAANFRKIEKIEPQAMRVLLDYPWPGNIRELHNVVEYAFAVGRGTTLRLLELPPEFREPRSLEQPKPALSMTTTEEPVLISQALIQSHGKITPAAQLLGMSRATFWRKRKQYGL